MSLVLFIRIDHVHTALALMPPCRPPRAPLAIPAEAVSLGGALTHTAVLDTERQQKP